MVQIATDAPPQGTVGDVYTLIGDIRPSQWVPDGTLPSGCQLDPNTGVLTRRLAEAGTYPFTVKMTDAAGQSQSRGFTIIVNPKLVMLDEGCLCSRYPRSVADARVVVMVSSTRSLSRTASRQIKTNLAERALVRAAATPPQAVAAARAAPPTGQRP
jgi:hypothetical protein